MAEFDRIVSVMEMPEYIKLCNDGTLERFKLDGEFYAVAYRRWKAEEKAKGTLKGWC